MANVFHHFTPGSFILPNSGAAGLRVADGAAFPLGSLEFPAEVVSSAFVKFRANNYLSGVLNLYLDWYAVTGSTGSIEWQAALAAITPNTDAVDILTKTLDTQQIVTQAHLGGVGKRPHRATISLSEADLDGLVADDDVWIAIRRADDDTLPGAARLFHLSASYVI